MQGHGASCPSRDALGRQRKALKRGLWTSSSSAVFHWVPITRTSPCQQSSSPNSRPGRPAPVRTNQPTEITLEGKTSSRSR